MNKPYYVYRAKFGRSKIFKKIKTTIDSYYPYMTDEWRYSFAFQLFYIYCKKGPIGYLSRIIHNRFTVHRELAYYLNGLKEHTLSDNLELWRKCNENI